MGFTIWQSFQKSKFDDTRQVLYNTSHGGQMDEKVSITEDDKLLDITNALDDTDPWNPKIVSFLMKMGEKTRSYQWMHQRAAQHNYRMDRIYKIIHAVLAALSTIFEGGRLLSLIFSDLPGNVAVLIALNCIQLLLLFVTDLFMGIRHAAEYDKLVTKHDHSASKFSDINLSIQNQLALHIKG